VSAPTLRRPGAVTARTIQIGLGLIWLSTGTSSSSPRYSARPSAALAEGPFGERGGRVVWAALWTGMGALWLLPTNRAAGASSSAVAGAASGQPDWLAGPQTALAHALSGHGTEVAIMLAVASVAIG